MGNCFVLSGSYINGWVGESPSKKFVVISIIAISLIFIYILFAIALGCIFAVIFSEPCTGKHIYLTAAFVIPGIVIVALLLIEIIFICCYDCGGLALDTYRKKTESDVLINRI